MKILVLNSGSSSQKSCLYEIGDALPQHPPEPQWEGKIEWSGDQADMQREKFAGAQSEGSCDGRARARTPSGSCSTTCGPAKLRAVSAPSEIDVVAHRIVHGGTDFEESHRGHA